MHQAEQNLVERAQNGDTRAFEILIQQCDRKVLEMAYSLLGNRQDAEDVYQETMLKAYTRLESFRGESRFSTWLCRIAIHHAINRRRARARRRWFSLHDSEDTVLSSEIARNHRPAVSAEQRVLDQEFHRHLQRALDRLSVRERAAFVLKHFHDYKIVEIADALNCSPGSIKSYLFRATRKLRGTLQSYQSGK